MKQSDWAAFPYKNEVALKLERCMNAKLISQDGFIMNHYTQNGADRHYRIALPTAQEPDSPPVGFDLFQLMNSRWADEQKVTRFIVKNNDGYLRVILFDVHQMVRSTAQLGAITKTPIVKNILLPASQPFSPDVYYAMQNMHTIRLDNYGLTLFTKIANECLKAFVNRVVEAREAYRLVQLRPNDTMYDSAETFAIFHNLHERLTQIARLTGVPTKASGQQPTGRDVLLALRRGIFDARVPF